MLKDAFKLLEKTRMQIPSGEEFYTVIDPNQRANPYASARWVICPA